MLFRYSASDVTDRENLKASARLIKDGVGYINLRVANSGIADPSRRLQPGATIERVQDAHLLFGYVLSVTDLRH